MRTKKYCFFTVHPEWIGVIVNALENRFAEQCKYPRFEVQLEMDPDDDATIHSAFVLTNLVGIPEFRRYATQYEDGLRSGEAMLEYCDRSMLYE